MFNSKSKAYNLFFKIASLMVAGTLLLSAAGCSKGKEASASSQLDKIKKSGKLVIGTSADYPPYEFHKEVDGKDTIVGFDIELARAIAKDLGVELEVKDMKFDGLLAALSSGKVDMVVAGMTPTEERKANVDFSNIYYKAKQNIVVRKSDSGTLSSLDALKSKAAGVQKGSIQEGIAKDVIKTTNIKGLGKISDLILELKNSKVDYIIVEAPVAKSYVEKNPDLAIASIDIQDAGDEGSAVAVKKNSTELVNFINKTLQRLLAENKIDELVKNANELVEQ